VRRVQRVTPARYVPLTWLLCALISTAPYGATGEEDKAAKLQQLRQQIQDLQKSLGAARDQQAELRESLRRSEVEIGRISRILKDLRKQLRRQTRALKDLEARRGKEREALGAQREAIARQMVASYAMGRQGQLKIVLNQQDPAAIARTLTYYDYFIKARAARIAAIDHTLAELTQTEQDISAETNRLDRLRIDQADRLSALQQTRRTRAEVLAKLEAEIRTKQQRLDQLLKDEARLARLVQRLREALSDIPPDAVGVPFSQLKGRLAWPVDGRVTARFGETRKPGTMRWQGVMLQAEQGREVHAVYHGRVAFADWLRGFGLLIIIDHGDGFMSLYGHNESLYKSPGDWVEGGELIATVGDSGGRAEPGLYFEIRHNGRPADPARWCVARK